jgi:hypothetical protein
VGLTIHYQLHSDTRSPQQARRLVEQLRAKAMDLPFEEVGEVVDLTGDGCDFHNYDREHPLRWLVIQAGQRVIREDVYYAVTPKHIIAFSTYPGEGCEPANFGLCRYPGKIRIEDPRAGQARSLLTGLKGWSWGSFCRTQYASQLGVEHFLRCHLLVIKMLDHARQLGILGHVKDEGEFWEKRDVKALAQEVGLWNEMIAGVAGRLKDQFGDNFIAPIADYPDFEHLEAKGQQPKRTQQDKAEGPDR